MAGIVKENHFQYFCGFDLQTMEGKIALIEFFFIEIYGIELKCIHKVSFSKCDD